MEFADDLARLSHTQQQIQEKTNIAAEHSARPRLNIHERKSEVVKVNSTSAVSVTLGVEAIEEVEHFTYLGSVLDTQGGIEADVKARILARQGWPFFNRRISKIKRPFAEKQHRDFQYKCQGCSSLRSRDMEDKSDYNKEDTDLCQQLSKKNPWCQ